MSPFAYEEHRIQNQQQHQTDIGHNFDRGALKALVHSVIQNPEHESAIPDNGKETEKTTHCSPRASKPS
jgi:hypothetical protein